VPPRNFSAVVALGLLASIFGLSVLNCARVRSLVQHLGLEPGPVHGTEHCWFKSVATILVVVCRSHLSWRQTNSPSFVNVTSHSTMPAPMRAPALYATSVCSGNCSAAVPDREISSIKRTVFATRQLVFEFALVHTLNQIKRAADQAGRLRHALCSHLDCLPCLYPHPRRGPKIPMSKLRRIRLCS
jgi:hypothetical protein